MNIEKVGVKVGDVWEATSGYSREIVFVSQAGLAISIDITHIRLYHPCWHDADGKESGLSIISGKRNLAALIERDGQKVPQAGEWCTGQQWVELFGGSLDKFEIACRNFDFQMLDVNGDWVIGYPNKLKFIHCTGFRLRLAEGQELPVVEKTKTVAERIADVLFRVGTLAEAKRLKLEIEGKAKCNFGWCHGTVVDRVNEILEAAK